MEILTATREMSKRVTRLENTKYYPRTKSVQTSSGFKSILKELFNRGLAASEVVNHLVSNGLPIEVAKDMVNAYLEEELVGNRLGAADLPDIESS